MDNIKNFQNGSIITRTKPSKSKDRSFIGDKMKLLKVEDNSIVLYLYDKFGHNRGKKTLSLYEYENGWLYYNSNKPFKKDGFYKKFKILGINLEISK